MHCHLRGKNSPPAGARHAGPSPIWALSGQSAHLAKDAVYRLVLLYRFAKVELQIRVTWLYMVLVAWGIRCFPMAGINSSRRRGMEVVAVEE